MTSYNFVLVMRLRVEGATWEEVAREVGAPSGEAIRKAYARYVQDQAKASGMRILGLDIETAPNTAHVWGLFKQNIGINQILQTGRVMCFAARWFSLPGSEIKFYSEHRHGHTEMVQEAWTLLDEADAVVHYNGSRFDVPTLNREFLKAGLRPPSPYKQIDLLSTAKKQFRFVSNRLDHLLAELGLGSKVRHDGHEMWIKCMNGDAEAWSRMEEYNIGDVTKMERLYWMMLPWITNHPNHALYLDANSEICTNCGGSRLQKRGKARSKTQEYQRFQCLDCGTWNRARLNSTPPHKRSTILTQALPG